MPEPMSRTNNHLWPKCCSHSHGQSLLSEELPPDAFLPRPNLYNYPESNHRGERRNTASPNKQVGW